MPVISLLLAVFSATLPLANTRQQRCSRFAPGAEFLFLLAGLIKQQMGKGWSMGLSQIDSQWR
jgi:hypothetical protein